MDKCRFCGAPVIWVQTDKGKTMPIDPDPVEHGNLRLIPVGETGKVHYLKKGELEEDSPEPRYVSHFATCPNAKQHRKG